MSREGENVTIFREGRELISAPGDYGDEGFIVQAYAPLSKAIAVLPCWQLDRRRPSLRSCRPRGPFAYNRKSIAFRAARHSRVTGSAKQSSRLPWSQTRSRLSASVTPAGFWTALSALVVGEATVVPLHKTVTEPWHSSIDFRYRYPRGIDAGRNLSRALSITAQFRT